MSDYSKRTDAENERKIKEIISELPPFAKLYFDDARRSRQSRTRLGYARDLQHFFNWLKKSAGFRDTDLNAASAKILEKLTFEDFEEYKNSMEFSSKKDSHGNPLLTENTTMARRLSAIRSFMKFYYTSGQIRNNPAMYVSMPKIKDHNIITLEPEDADRILELTENFRGLTQNQIARRKKTVKRDAAILMTLLGTGIRVSELVGLNVTSVDFRNARLLITLKGGNEGYAFFGPEVEDALQDYMENCRSLLNPSPSENALFLSVRRQRMTVRAVELLVKEYAERAGVTDFERITPHKLRATFGTHLYAQSGDIRLVGSALHHKSIETTSKHYVKDSEDHQRKVIEYSSKLFQKE